MKEAFQYLPFDLVGRKYWGAHDAVEDYIQLAAPAAYVIHTYTDSPPCFERGECIKAVRNLQARDLAAGMADIRYNFVIGEDSSVYVGRGWTNLPDTNEDFPHLYERSIEIAHIGFQGEPSDEILHIAKLLMKYGIMKNHLRSNFKYVKHFKEIVKDEEYYEIGSSGNLELTCYKKLGESTERDESDEYRVLADLSPGRPPYWLDKDDVDTPMPELEDSDSVDVIDGIKMDPSLLSEDELAEITKKTSAIDNEPEPSAIGGGTKTYVY